MMICSQNIDTYHTAIVPFTQQKPHHKTQQTNRKLSEIQIISSRLVVHLPVILADYRKKIEISEEYHAQTHSRVNINTFF